MSTSTSRPPAATSSTNGAPPPPPAGKTYFEQQREMLVGEIAQSLEHVLHNINKLNRSLEGVIAVGNEFSSVEALWSQFENVMAKDPDVGAEADRQGEGEEAEAGEEGDTTAMLKREEKA